mmetsp:Transcript_5295/g.11774  ORF Transcript_5295/g.11774 Transcript_5295/m.11774 type:complete len:81 (+) Transcript_5295:1-243(+)
MTSANEIHYETAITAVRLSAISTAADGSHELVSCIRHQLHQPTMQEASVSSASPARSRGAGSSNSEMSCFNCDNSFSRTS